MKKLKSKFKSFLSKFSIYEFCLVYVTYTSINSFIIDIVSIDFKNFNGGSLFLISTDFKSYFYLDLLFIPIIKFDRTV